MSNQKPIVTNMNVYGLDESIKAAKYPMSVHTDILNSDITKGVNNLATSKTGEGHDQFLTGITVQFDLNATLKFWIEAERYRFLYFISSQSTMHRMCKFNLDKAYNEYVDPLIIQLIKALVKDYESICEEKGSDSFDAKEAYLRVLYNNPAGFILTARMTTNYRQLKTIYQQRKNHRLPEWRRFCDWIEELPESQFIIGNK